VRLVGRFASVSQRETAAAIRRRGGVLDPQSPEWVIVGEETPPAGRDEAHRLAAEVGAECVTESELWRRLGLVDDSADVRRLYSPAMLAELVGAPVAAVRRWARRGLLRPACRVNRLAYFDFEEARVAGLLAELLRQSGSLAAVDRRVDRLRVGHPNLDRPLAELPLSVVEGVLLVRSDTRLADASGQGCFDFDSGEPPAEGVVMSLPLEERPPASLRDRAWELSEAGRVGEAVEAWRLAMLESPPTADDQFTLAEWLYQAGQREAARERYYAALELDGDHLEARVSLGCVLADLGEHELAIASLEGAVEQHELFADAHFHLARLHQAAGRGEAARPHWRRFLEIAPESPWAGEARVALAEAAGD